MNRCVTLDETTYRGPRLITYIHFYDEIMDHNRVMLLVFRSELDFLFHRFPNVLRWKFNIVVFVVAPGISFYYYSAGYIYLTHSIHLKTLKK